MLGLRRGERRDLFVLGAERARASGKMPSRELTRLVAVDHYLTKPSREFTRCHALSLLIPIQTNSAKLIRGQPLSYYEQILLLRALGALGFKV